MDDRTGVKIVLHNLSPLDVCSLGARTVAPTAEVNPIEALINTLSAAQTAFSLGSAAGGLPLASPAPVGPAVGILSTRPKPDEKPDPLIKSAVYAQFKQALDDFDGAAQRATRVQDGLRDDLRWAVHRRSNYVAQDFREVKWRGFDPQKDLASIRLLVDQTLPSVQPSTIAALQLANVDATLGAAHKTYDTYCTAVPERPDDCKLLVQMDQSEIQAKANSKIIDGVNTTLTDAQTKLRTDVNAILLAENDFKRKRTNPQLIKGDLTLYQEFNLPTDRKATITGTLSCVSSIDGKPTTDAINYSILYQDVPRLTASAGLITTFQKKWVYGVETPSSQIIPSTTPPPPPATTFNNAVVAVTDSGRAQVFPMAYLNWRFGPYNSFHSLMTGRTKEDETIVTYAVSSGFGINPNSGTNQPEFFTGIAIGINRVMIHPGVHWGRRQFLAGGYALGQLVPAGTTAIPVSWSYHPAFSIGFSARIAPF